MPTVRLTAAQALVRYLGAQRTADGATLVAGVWAIFGHGNVAALGEALYAHRETLPTWRGHNEQAMAHAAIGFAKASNRRRLMAVTTSIGPGATNLVTAAATAHVNRLPLLLLPGDVFASRRPDPVLQQIEDFADGTVSANDTLRPVSRYFDRITRPEQLLSALPRAIATLTDPATCGPVTLSLCQDVQAEAWEWPEDFFAERVVASRRIRPDRDELRQALALLRGAQRPLIIAGGGVHYAHAVAALRRFAERHHVPVAETQAGKSAMAPDDPLNLGAVGVTGSSAANTVASTADVVLAIGTRLQDFTTGSRTLFAAPGMRLIALNVTAFDAGKHGALGLVCDAAEGLRALDEGLGEWRAPTDVAAPQADWQTAVAAATASGEDNALPSDAQVIGAVQRSVGDDAVVVCAAGGLPGELHKLWRSGRANGYHLEYGYSCMGYEIAGGLGVKMALPAREVVVMVGDGSYLMLNSELATSVVLGIKLIVVVLDNGGFGCINRLQLATGNASFNNLRTDPAGPDLAAAPAPTIDLAAHARALGTTAERVAGVSELEAAMGRARAAASTYCIVIETDPGAATADGGHWWDVAVPEVSERAEVRAAHGTYRAALTPPATSC